MLVTANIHIGASSSVAVDGAILADGAPILRFGAPGCIYHDVNIFLTREKLADLRDLIDAFLAGPAEAEAAIPSLQPITASVRQLDPEAWGQ